MDGEYLVGGCTAFEKKLLETQEVMTIRGKVQITFIEIR